MKEELIRPQKIFDEYLRLAAIDATAFFKSEDFEDRECPACMASGNLLFEKHGFRYEECDQCKTIYANPRPTTSSLANFYENGASTTFWATDFYRATSEARRERLWKPKAKEVNSIIEKWAPDTKWVADIGGGYGIFAEEFKALTQIRSLVVEPSPSLSKICREKNLEVLQKFAEDLSPQELPEDGGALVSFELFEHLHDPRAFLRKVHELLPKRGLFIMTTLSGMGLDIRTLGKASKAIFPPHHLNFFNPKSIRQLFESEKLEVLQVLTPGKLDIDIMANNIDAIADSFWKSFLEYSTDEEMRLMQKAIAEMGLSSHMWVVAKKPE